MEFWNSEADLTEHIRERYTYLSDRWRKSREERKIDYRYLLGDPWKPEDRKAREDAGRPCLNHDELRQYINQAINAVRKNKRGIKIDPDGKGSDEKSAELRQDIIRTIEYKCGAPSIYITSGFEPAVRGSYGFFRITRQYVGKSFDQEIVIKPLLNPDAVLFDWDCKEVDWSDGKDCFVLDWMLKSEFKRKYKAAEVKDFSADIREAAPSWIQTDKILVAEYWRVESKPRKLYLMQNGEIIDHAPEQGYEPIAQREYEDKTVVQYITNGVEILRNIPQPGEILPIIPVLGEEIWVDEGSGAERKLLSLIRLARDPQMSLAYLVSQMAEEAKLTPKAPYMGYKGQFESDATAWEQLTSNARAFVQVDPMVDGATGQVLPLPNRIQFTPHFGEYIQAEDSCRRAVQAAMGISPLPTAAQRQNEKSGIALQRLVENQEIGSFHFQDNFDRQLRLAGRVMDSWLDVVYDSEREMMLRKNDDTFYSARLNTEAPYIDDKKQEQHFKIDESQHHVTISTGPSNASQREEASDFLDVLIGNLRNLPIAPEQMARLLGVAIRMKQLGPKGDEMADIIDPKKEGAQIPPEVQQQVQQMQALNEYAKQKESEIAELQKKLDAQVVSNEYKLEIEKLRIEADIAKAEIATKAQSMEERLAFVEDLMKQFDLHQHEASMQAMTHDHERQLAEQAAAQAPAPEEETQL
jgi:hypothetical protein